MLQINCLYPYITPYKIGQLKVSDIHTLYYEESGNPDGIPVVFLHGGPGAGCSEHHRRFFNPNKYRIILFDQRGCGRSTPYAELKENTPDNLRDDIEKLRLHLNIKKWVIFGGSWGSALATHYAISYSESCIALILRGIYKFTKSEIDWFMHKMGLFQPEAYEIFKNYVKDIKKDTLLEKYIHLTQNPDPTIYEPAAIEWCRFETACATLLPLQKHNEESAESSLQQGIALGRFESLYMYEYAFDDSYLSSHIHKVKNIPLHIVQGRYDLICPPQTAYSVHQLWEGSKLHIIQEAGHSAFEPPIAKKLVEIMDNL